MPFGNVKMEISHKTSILFFAVMFACVQTRYARHAFRRGWANVVVLFSYSSNIVQLSINLADVHPSFSKDKN